VRGSRADPSAESAAESASESAPEFAKVITRLDATALCVGSMIGSGIFIVSANILRQVEAPGLLLAVWALAGAVTLMGALSYGELAAMFPKAGGQYVYLREAISPLFGYLYGWTLFMVIQTGTIAAVAVAFARFTAVFVPGLSADVFLGTTINLGSGPIEVGLSAQRLFAVGSVVLLTWINVRGVHTAALIQTTLTIIKTAALAGLILLGLTLGRNADAISANFGAGFGPAGGFSLALLPMVGAAMVGSLFSMDAWNNVGFASGEMKDPAKDLPFAMAAGVLVVTVLYVLANVAYLSALTGAEIQTAPEDRVGTAALQAMVGDVGLYVMAGAIMISTFGCNNGLILSGARVYYAMARDNLFFRRTGELHPEYRTPAFALVAQAIWTSVLCLSGTYSELLNYVIFAAVLFYMITGVGLFALRVRRPDAVRPVKTVAYPWLPAAYVVLTGLICVNLLVQPAQQRYAGLGLIIVALGVPVYFGWRRFVAPRAA
jgi:APA family basic amino acid/polyamine antiporter